MTSFRLVVHVSCHVQADCVDAFRDAALINARASVQEAGIETFDVLQDLTDPSRFVIVEVFRTAEAPALHKETEHYKVWRDTVATMMVTPRSAKKFALVGGS